MTTSKKLEELVEESYQKIKEIYDSPHAAKVNLMRTDGKLAINVLSTYRTIRQSDSGDRQSKAVIARMVCESKEEMRKFIEKNLPEITIPTKQLKG